MTEQGTVRMKVFVVVHVHEITQDQEDVKLIGVYSTEERAKEAIRRSLLLPGFAESTDGFGIDAYEVDEDHWTEGYVTLD